MPRKKKKKYLRSPHPGVIILPPRGAHSWRARWVDPDSGKQITRTFPENVTTADQRKAWCEQKSEEIRQRKVELSQGAPRATGQKLADAIDKYFANNMQLATSTREGTRRSVNNLLAFAKSRNAESCDDITRPFLMEFRGWLVELKKRVPVAGLTVEERGGPKARPQRPSSDVRQTSSVNRDIGSTRAVLSYLVDLGQLPRLRQDDLAVALKKLPPPTRRIRFLALPQIPKLVEAALQHDTDKQPGWGYALTTGRTKITPILLFILLIGCRREEALRLDWADVDLSATDYDGNVVGEVHILGKGDRQRTIGLEVSPFLLRLLSDLHEKAGRPTRGKVFDVTLGALIEAKRRLKSSYGAPTFTWHMLRRTTGTVLTNAPGIFGAASAYRSARQLGHSVAVAERHYVGLVRGIPLSAKTVEAAMGLSETLANV